MQLIVPKDIEQWLDNTREHRSRAAQIIKLLRDVPVNGICRNTTLRSTLHNRPKTALTK